LRVALPDRTFFIGGRAGSGEVLNEVRLTQRYPVLLVDDQESVLRALTRMLVSANFEVLGARNGELALQQVRSMNRSPSILITDINMPVMNGFDLARAFRSMLPAVPILLMTGLNCPANGIEAHRLGLELLLKPFGPELFLDTVTRLLDQPSANRSLA
jgi:DNA-binding response OmpR family regulator